MNFCYDPIMCRFLNFCSRIIKISKRILVMTAGKSFQSEDLQNLFPSLVWLLRDVILTLPKGVENIKECLLERVNIDSIQSSLFCYFGKMVYRMSFIKTPWQGAFLLLIERGLLRTNRGCILISNKF